jgi:hypothetical protein
MVGFYGAAVVFQTHISDNLFGAVDGCAVQISYGKWRKSGK